MILKMTLCCWSIVLVAKHSFTGALCQIGNITETRIWQAQSQVKENGAVWFFVKILVANLQSLILLQYSANFIMYIIKCA